MIAHGGEDGGGHTLRQNAPVRAAPGVEPGGEGTARPAGDAAAFPRDRCWNCERNPARARGLVIGNGLLRAEPPCGAGQDPPGEMDEKRFPGQHGPEYDRPRHFCTYAMPPCPVTTGPPGGPPIGPPPEKVEDQPGPWLILGVSPAAWLAGLKSVGGAGNRLASDRAVTGSGHEVRREEPGGGKDATHDGDEAEGLEGAGVFTGGVHGV